MKNKKSKVGDHGQILLHNIQENMFLFREFDIALLSAGESSIAMQGSMNFTYFEALKVLVVNSRHFLEMQQQDEVKPVFSLDIDVFFGVGDTIIPKEEGCHLFHESLIITAASLAYSTGRGILYEKTRGSYSNRFILPIINPGDLIKDIGRNQDGLLKIRQASQEEIGRLQIGVE